MQITDNKLIACLSSGLAKGWHGFVWMLKIIVPISFCTSCLAWSGWIDRLDFILEPVMGVLGLPPMAALPLIAGLLTGIYGAIAAMAPLPLTVEQMTLLAIFLLISHNLVQESVVQRQSGFTFLKAAGVRLLASFATVVGVDHFMGSEISIQAVPSASGAIQIPFSSMLQAWLWSTLGLAGKILVIIMVLMTVLEILKHSRLIDRIVGGMAPVLKALGLSTRSGFLWLTAALFGLTYGAAVIVEEVKEGSLSKDELDRLHLSVGINHAMVEDTALFLSLGLSLFWLTVPRLIAAMVAVQLFLFFKRMTSHGGFPRFSYRYRR